MKASEVRLSDVQESDIRKVMDQIIQEEGLDIPPLNDDQKHQLR